LRGSHAFIPGGKKRGRTVPEGKEIHIPLLRKNDTAGMDSMPSHLEIAGREETSNGDDQKDRGYDNLVKALLPRNKSGPISWALGEQKAVEKRKKTRAHSPSKGISRHPTLATNRRRPKKVGKITIPEGLKRAGTHN